jgi:uncharacterized membrane-anchored protein
MSGVLGLAAVAVVLAKRRGAWSLLDAGVAAVTVVLAFVIGGLGALVLVMAVAGVTGRRALALGTAVGAIWVTGSFYYALHWSLVDKATLMIGAGVAIGALAWVAHAGVPSLGREHADAGSPVLAGSLVALGAVAVGLLAGWSVQHKEEILRSGRTVYVSLAPVDPRSLVQGDYMTLNFALPRLSAKPRPGERMWATAVLDARNVASFTSTSAAPPEVKPGEIVLVLAAKGERWIVSTDAWHFKEGTAAKWQAARFGVFRVGADGTPLLVNLADADLRMIE